MIIAIDGPAGAGKSTIAKIVAQKLGFLYIDTGAMYRALTLKAIESKIDITDTAKIIAMARSTQVSLENDAKSLRVLLDGIDVSEAIRETRVTRYVSDVAKIKEVREILVQLQRKLGSQRNALLDGRDIGTVVFPQAELKFYLDANFKERAKRRFNELKALGKEVTLEDIEHDVQNRDTIDSTREHAPLKKADDAISIDTTPLSIEQVVEKLLMYISSHHG
ncbi:MAG TPA: (d)CMP kinase [Candidatus Omnitrophota bacterium]|nr:(d)CMP kinase [Candidatus Omnitrophota bacterium]